MIFFTTLIATFNLCLGYWLGVKVGAMPWQGSGDDSLVTVLSKGLKAKAAKESKTTTKETSSKNAEPVKPAATSEPTEASEPEPAEPDAKPTTKAPTADVINNLAAFQAQLANAGKQLRESLDDPEAFDQQATQLQETQHELVDQAKEDVAKLGLDASDPDSESINEGAENVGKISEKIDALMAEEERTESDREEILNQTEALSSAFKGLSDVVAAHDAGAPKTAEEAASDIIRQIDQLSDLVAEALSEQGEGHPPLLASLRLDDFEGLPDGADSSVVEQRLLAQLASMVKADATDIELFGKERELVALFHGKSVDDTSTQLDTWRQQVEAAQFNLDGQSFKTTITCLLSEGEEDLDAWLERIEEAHAESGRYGNNRTYHHDGAFAAPVAPADTKVESDTITI